MAEMSSRPDKKNKKVFISYSSRDAKRVEQLVLLLQNLGITYWKAPEMIPAGSNYAREIPRAIQDCEVFLLVLSRTAQESIWVEKEVDAAVCNRKTIIPFQLDETPLNPMYRFYLNNVQMIAAAHQPELALEELKRQLCRLLGMTCDEVLNGTEEQEQSSENIEDSSSTEETRLAGLGITELDGSVEERNRKMRKKSEAFLWNPQPAECEYCGGDVEPVSLGIYRCVNCGKENYDSYRKVRMYLEENGAAPAVVISKATGVPRKVIDHFFREEYLEIPKYSPVRLSCAQCGAPIRTGTHCERCKQIKASTPAPSPREQWHSNIGKGRR